MQKSGREYGYTLKIICWNWMERIHLVKEKKKIIMSLSLSWEEEEEVWRRDCGEMKLWNAKKI